MLNQVALRTRRPLVAILFASSVMFSGAQSAPPQPPQNASQPTQSASNPAPAAATAAGTAQSATPAGASTQPNAAGARPAPPWQGAQLRGLSHRADMYYEGVWGVSELRVRAAESGQLIRFNYRVLDPAKATVLNDKKVEPVLYDAQAGVKLVVPQMEKIGKLRQNSTPKAGMTYWMAFSNPTLAVKRGHRVDIVIGGFRANHLVVE